MSAWDWTMLLGALASIAGAALFFIGRASTPPPPPVERIEPTHPEPELNGQTADVKVVVRNSPGAKAAGRDMGKGGSNTEHKADVEIVDSANASAAGRDDRRA